MGVHCYLDLVTQTWLRRGCLKIATRTAPKSPKIEGSGGECRSDTFQISSQTRTQLLLCSQLLTV